MNWNPLIEIPARLERDSSGAYFCPAHEDETPSLSFGTGRDGSALLKCHAGCSTDAIVEGIGLTVRDLFRSNEQVRSRSKRSPSTLPRRAASASKVKLAPKELSVESTKLLDDQERYVVTQLRITLDSLKANGKARKKFSYADITGRRRKLSDLGLKANDLPMWNSAKLAKHPGRIVIITEGTKAARALIAALARDGLSDAFVVLATVAGAEVLPCAARLECLRDRVVRLWRDNDEGGRKHMDEIATWAPAAETATIQIDGLPLGGDADDFFKAGGTILDMLEALR